jgi:hypothetical protein
LNPGALIPVVTKFLGPHGGNGVDFQGSSYDYLEKQIPSEELNEPLLEAGLMP